jgi:hypothetical protein
MPNNPKVTYQYSRLTFKRDLIEPLAWSDEFRVVTRDGTFQMSKTEFYESFPGVVKSRSYQESGYYNYSPVPAKARRFQINETGGRDNQPEEASGKSPFTPQNISDSADQSGAGHLTRSISEANLESILAERTDLLEDGLELMQTQYHCAGVGRIDILCRDREGNLVVVELKKFGAQHHSVLDQVLRYMGYIKEHVAEANQEVRGIIVVGKVDEKLRYAVSAVSNVTVKTFDLTIK